MGKKDKDYEDDDGASEDWRAEPASSHSSSRLPAFSVGDIISILVLGVLSAALLLEGYYSGFKDYSGIVTLFAIVAGFLLGRKT
jgi:hypothetical protein